MRKSGCVIADGNALKQAARALLAVDENDELESQEPEPELRLDMRLPMVLPAHQVGRVASYGGDSCPMCLDDWDSAELVECSAVVLQCGHACCQTCLVDFYRQCALPFAHETATVARRIAWCCPCCREALDEDPSVYGLDAL